MKDDSYLMVGDVKVDLMKVYIELKEALEKCNDDFEGLKPSRLHTYGLFAYSAGMAAGIAGESARLKPMVDEMLKILKVIDDFLEKSEILHRFALLITSSKGEA